jgi:hypothetical protein
MIIYFIGNYLQYFKQPLSMPAFSNRSSHLAL